MRIVVFLDMSGMQTCNMTVNNEIFEFVSKPQESKTNSSRGRQMSAILYTIFSIGLPASRRSYATFGLLGKSQRSDPQRDAVK